MKAISLFSGAGGLDIGAKMVGYDIVCSVDSDLDSIKTLQKNSKDAKSGFIQLDVTKINGNELLEIAGYRSGEISLVIGGPPCQSFSKNNYWSKTG